MIELVLNQKLVSIQIIEITTEPGLFYCCKGSPVARIQLNRAVIWCAFHKKIWHKCAARQEYGHNADIRKYQADLK